MAQVLFNSVEFYEARLPASQKFRELGLRADQTIAHLNKFYPNGEGIPDDSALMKQGVGTAALEIIVADARERGAKIIHVFSTARPGMLAFMERYGIKTYHPEPREDVTRPKYRLACKLL